MKVRVDEAWKRALAVSAICFILGGQFLWAQNLGTQPATNVAVQGQTAAQPEGAFLNFINWIGNVIAPVGAGGAVVGAVVSWLHGRGVGRWLAAAAGLLAGLGGGRVVGGAPGGCGAPPRWSAPRSPGPTGHRATGRTR